MKRRYRIARFLRRCEELRGRLDLPALTTDVIVGFPGESEADFAQTLAAVRDAGFAKIHIFPFSSRRGTVAAQMPDQVTPAVIADRRRALAEVEQALAVAYHQLLVGKKLEMLVERPDDGSRGVFRGTACRYVPLRISGAGVQAGQLVPVRVRSRADDGLLAEPLGKPTLGL